MSKPRDDVREAVLQYLYEVHQKARGPKAQAVKFSRLRQAMKERGHTQTEVATALDYLVQAGWVREVTQFVPYMTKQGGQAMSSVTSYKISDRGIDKFEEVSAFRREPSYSGINITNIQGTTVVGDRNVVNVRYSDLSRALLFLEDGVRASGLSDQDKLELLADIQSLHQQLVKEKPNPTVVSTLWSGIERIANAAGLVQAVAMVKKFIDGLIS